MDGSNLKAEIDYGDNGNPVFVNKRIPPPNSSTGDNGIGFMPLLLMLLSMLTALALIFTRKRSN